MTAETVVDREDEYTEDQTNNGSDWECSAFARASGGVDRGVVNVLERGLIEVTRRVRVRKDEEALGAALHIRDLTDVQNRIYTDLQSLKGFFRMRPVFFRRLPTFESCFFSSTFAFAGVTGGLAGVFFTGTAAAAAVGFGSSAFGSSVDGRTSGVGFIAAVGCGGTSECCAALRWVET